MKPRKRMPRVIAKARAKQMLASREDNLSHKNAIAERIKAWEAQGKIGVAWLTVDCDMVRSEGTSVIPATLSHFEAFKRGLEDRAEVMVSCQVASPHCVKPNQRDCALEAFEDGHPHFVTI
jgi:hypothetical protein